MNKIQLTEQQRKVLELMKCGMSIHEIADRLYLSPGTVKYHKTNIFKKLGVKCNAQAVVKAIKLGLISVD